MFANRFILTITNNTIVPDSGREGKKLFLTTGYVQWSGHNLPLAIVVARIPVSIDGPGSGTFTPDTVREHPLNEVLQPVCRVVGTALNPGRRKDTAA